MALGLYFTPTTPMTAQKYDDCINRLKKAGAAHPAGRLYHAAFESSDGLTVFDVWTSQAAFDAFGQTLMPIMQEIGVNPGQPSVMPVYNVIVPPAARPRSKAKAIARAKTKAKPKAKKRPEAQRAAKGKKKSKKR